MHRVLLRNSHMIFVVAQIKYGKLKRKRLNAIGICELSNVYIWSI